MKIDNIIKKDRLFMFKYIFKRNIKRNKDNNAILELVCYYNSKKIIKYLINNHSNLCLNNNLTLIQYCSSKGYIETIKTLLKYRNINTISKLEWNSNYLLASENKQLDTCKFLYNIKPATNEIIKPLYYKNTINNNLLNCKWLLEKYPINLSELRFKSDIYDKVVNLFWILCDKNLLTICKWLYSNKSNNYKIDIMNKKSQRKLFITLCENHCNKDKYLEILQWIYLLSINPDKIVSFNNNIFKKLSLSGEYKFTEWIYNLGHIKSSNIIKNDNDFIIELSQSDNFNIFKLCYQYIEYDGKLIKELFENSVLYQLLYQVEFIYKKYNELFNNNLLEYANDLIFSLLQDNYIYYKEYDDVYCIEILDWFYNLNNKWFIENNRIFNYICRIKNYNIICWFMDKYPFYKYKEIKYKLLDDKTNIETEYIRFEPIILKTHVLYMIYHKLWSNIAKKFNMIQLNNNNNSKILDSNDECDICFENNINCLTNCNHKYCFQCLYNWIEIKKKETCPYCRKKIILSESMININ